MLIESFVHLEAGPGSRVQTVGSESSLALIPASLDQAEQTAHAQNATVNDVLLAVTTGAAAQPGRTRRWPHRAHRGAVTLRPAQDRDQPRGNLIGQFVVPLPVGVAGPGRRLAPIVTKTTTRKAESHPSVRAMLRSRIGRRELLETRDRQPINVTSADVPGPQFPLYLAGAQLLEVFPALPLIANVSLAVGAMSYAGQFNIMAVAVVPPHRRWQVDLVCLPAARGRCGLGTGDGGLAGGGPLALLLPSAGPRRWY